MLNRRLKSGTSSSDSYVNEFDWCLEPCNMCLRVHVQAPVHTSLDVSHAPHHLCSRVIDIQHLRMETNVSVPPSASIQLQAIYCIIAQRQGGGGQQQLPAVLINWTLFSSWSHLLLTWPLFVSQWCHPASWLIIQFLTNRASWQECFQKRTLFLECCSHSFLIFLSFKHVSTTTCYLQQAESFCIWPLSSLICGPSSLNGCRVQARLKDSDQFF